MKYTRANGETACFLAFEVPRSVADEVESGRALLETTFDQNGIEPRVRFLLPPGLAHRPYSLTEANRILVDQRTLTAPDNGVNRNDIIATFLREEWKLDDPKGRKGGDVMASSHTPPLPFSFVSPDFPGSSGKEPDSPDAGTASGAPVIGESRAMPAAPQLAEIQKRLVAVVSSQNPDYNEAIKAAAGEVGDLTAIKVRYDEALRSVTSRNLDRNRKQGVLNVFPARSLVPEEFKRRNIDDLYLRAVVVAHNITEAKCVSRIACDPFLHTGGATSLHEWWIRATAEQRFRLLTESKSLKNVAVPLQGRRRLLLCPSPFQDAGAQQKTL